MKTLIYYATKYGTTEHVAHLMAKSLSEHGTVEVSSVKVGREIVRIPDCKGVERIVLGVPVYGEKPLRTMSRFCRKNWDILTDYEGPHLYLFAMGVERIPRLQEQELINAFPERLVARARKRVFLLGRLDWDNMSRLHKRMVRKTTGLFGPRNGLSKSEVKDFVQKILRDKERMNKYYRVGEDEYMDRLLELRMKQLEKARLVMEEAKKQEWPPKIVKGKKNPYTW